MGKTIKEARTPHIDLPLFPSSPLIHITSCSPPRLSRTGSWEGGVTWLVSGNQEVTTNVSSVAILTHQQVEMQQGLLYSTYHCHRGVIMTHEAKGSAVLAWRVLDTGKGTELIHQTWEPESPWKQLHRAGWVIIVVGVLFRKHNSP